MTRCLRLSLLLIPLLLLTACGADGFYSTTLITDGQHVISEDQTLYGMLLVIDGEIHLQEGAQVTGSAYVLEGNFTLDGRVAGDVVQLGGRLLVGDDAQIDGDLRQAGGTFSLSPGARVQGRVLRGSEVELDLRPQQAEDSLFGRLAWFVIQALGLALLALLAVRFIPRPLAHVADALVEHPLTSVALGILVGIVAPSLLVMMAFAILLIPVTVLGLIVGGALIAYGLIACGFILGRILTRWRPDLSPSLAAFSGTFLFMASMEIVTIVPVVGGLLPLLLAVAGLGAVLLTRLGRQRFVPATERVAVS
jgi:hypothetical protein